MKSATAILAAVLATTALTGCSDSSVEEFAFRSMLEVSMAELCGEDDAACLEAVETQTRPCMRQADWRRYMENDEDPVELKRFTTEFYACVVDEQGNPWFTVDENAFTERETRDKGAISTASGK